MKDKPRFQPAVYCFICNQKPACGDHDVLLFENEKSGEQIVAHNLDLKISSTALQRLRSSKELEPQIALKISNEHFRELKTLYKKFSNVFNGNDTKAKDKASQKIYHALLQLESALRLAKWLKEQEAKKEKKVTEEIKETEEPVTANLAVA